MERIQSPSLLPSPDGSGYQLCLGRDSKLQTPQEVGGPGGKNRGAWIRVATSDRLSSLSDVTQGEEGAESKDGEGN